MKKFQLKRNNIHLRKGAGFSPSPFQKGEGFTFIETLIVIGIVGLLATTVVVGVNPARRFEEARDKQREIHLQTILSAIEQKRTVEGGWFGECGPLPQGVQEEGEEEKPIFKIIGTGLGKPNPDDYYNLFSCLVPIYLAEPLYDPAEGSEVDTRYQIWQNPYSKRVTLLYEKEEKKRSDVKKTIDTRLTHKEERRGEKPS